MADFSRRGAKSSGAPGSLKTGSKTKDATRSCTWTSDLTSETRAPLPSSAVSSALGSAPGSSLSGHGEPEYIEEEALASEPEEADSILEGSQDSGSFGSVGEVDIPAHRRAFHEADWEAAPHLAMQQGWEPGFVAGAGDDEGYDESYDAACVVVRLHPAMSGLQAGEQYKEVTLEEWQRSAGGGGDGSAEPEGLEPPGRPLGRLRPRGGGGAPLLAGSPAAALRRRRDAASPSSAAAASSSAEWPRRCP